jgi:G3E family GTPase
MTAHSSDDKIPVTILTGFLGSGKTTVLSHLIRQPAMTNAAVIINEFGEISLDHELVEKIDGDVIEIQGGCLCCTVRGDLIEALHNLLLKRSKGDIKAFDRVVLETTGLADPAPILHTLMSDPLAFNKFRLDGVIATVDAINGNATLNAHAEAVKQAAMADRILLTKCDLVDDATRATLEARLIKLNPGQAIIPVDHGCVEPQVILDLGPFKTNTKTADVEAWLRAESYASQHDHEHGHDHPVDVNRHDALVRAFSYVVDQPIPQAKLQFFLQLLGMLRGPDLLRVKGIVYIAERPDQPAVVHGVQHIFHPLTWLQAWPSLERRSRFVFIVRDIAPQQIQDLMASLTAT